MTSLNGKTKYIWALPLLILMILLFIFFKPTGVSQYNNENDHPVAVIRIAVPDMSRTNQPSSGLSWIDYLYVNKLFEQEFAQDNIKVEWNFFKGAGPAINEALVNEQLDFAFLGDFAAIIGKASQIDTKFIIATARQGNAYLAVQPNKGYTDLAALRGKRIAVWQGTASQLAFNQVLDYYGYSEKDFRIINLDAAAMNAALAAKQIDAGWGSLAMLALKQKGLVEVPISSRDTSPMGTLQAGVVARTAFVQQHPEIVQRVVNTVLKSSYWISRPENYDASIELITQNAGYPKDLYIAQFEGQKMSVVTSPLLDTAYINQLKQGVASALKARLIRQDFDVDQWVDDRFVNQGIRELGYQDVWQAQNQSLSHDNIQKNE